MLTFHKIANEKLPAYFVEVPGRPGHVFVIISITTEFHKKYDQAWRRLAKGEFLQVCLFDSWEAEEGRGKW